MSTKPSLGAPGVADSGRNCAAAWRITGRLDIAALGAALQELVRRHDALQSGVGPVEGRPGLALQTSAAVEVPMVDLGALAPLERRREADRQMRAAMRHRIDVRRAPLLHATLIRLAAGEHLLVVALHALVADRAALGVLSRDLWILYGARRGRPAPAPPVSRPWGDIVAGERTWLDTEPARQELQFWQRRLAGARCLDLPTAQARRSGPGSPPERAVVVLGPAAADRIRGLDGRDRGARVMTAVSVLAMLLHRWTGQDDVVVGMSIARREAPEVQDVIGRVGNVVMVRADLSGAPTFAELSRRLEAACREASAHARVPFESVRTALGPAADADAPSPCQVAVDVVEPFETPAGVGDVAVEWIDAQDLSAAVDLAVTVVVGREQARLEVAYDRALFSSRTVLALLDQFEHVLEHLEGPALERPLSEWSLVTARSRGALPDLTTPLASTWRGSVVDTFKEHVRRDPARLALTGGGGRYTYEALDRLSAALAGHLAARGVRKGDVVAIHASRGVNLVCAVMAVLRCGAAFTILDPAYPAGRLAQYVAIARPAALVVTSAELEVPAELTRALAPAASQRVVVLGDGMVRVGGEADAGGGEVPVGPDDIACITFTSGSTGVPKAVLGRHGPLSYFVPWQAKTFGLGDSDRYTMLSGLAHDPLQRDMFTPLQLGACLCIPPAEIILDAPRLVRWMQREAVTVAHLTPAMLQVIVQGAEGPALPSLRCALVVGDMLRIAQVQELYRIAPRSVCVGLYGATETQRAVGYVVVPRDGDGAAADGEWRRGIVPLGQGMTDVQLLVLTAGGRPAGVGECGEVYVRSPHLAAGYLGDERLTRERFVQNPAVDSPADRLYRTGDLGRYLSDGSVVPLGRKDQQVKIRGFRVELGEIEAAVCQGAGVRAAVVTAHEDAGGEKYLVAHVVPAEGQTLDHAALRAHLQQRLPAYMVPGEIRVRAGIPLTPNGKVDRDALSERRPGAPAGAAAAASPRAELEGLVAGVWCEVLGVAHIPRDVNFFEIGGSSLAAARVHAKLTRLLSSLGVRRRLTVIDLFRYPTVGAMARHLGAGR